MRQATVSFLTLHELFFLTTHENLSDLHRYKLEFDKIKPCCTKSAALNMQRQQRIAPHKKDFIDLALKQAHEMKGLLENNFPNDYVLNLGKDLKLLAIPGALLSAEAARKRSG